MTLRFAAIGLDHRHIYHMVGELLAAGAECAGFCLETSDPRVLQGFRERFPALAPRPREALFDDPAVDIILCAAIPRDRPGIAIRAMRAGKDVMLDKPGAVNLAQCAELERVDVETGRILSICFSERLAVRACVAAERLVAEGAIGRVIHTTGLGPHRLNRAIRPEWFFRPETFGGILTDIASHQIDQFMVFTGSDRAEVVSASSANRGLPDLPGFEDFGELLLRSDRASGFVRVDWFTPDGLPTWGDGRLFLLGTEGTTDRVRMLAFPDATPLALLIAQHEDIARRLETGDAAGAAAAMARHLREILRALSRIARDNPGLFSDTELPEHTQDLMTSTA